MTVTLTPYRKRGPVLFVMSCLAFGVVRLA